MNKALWTLQVLMAAIFMAHGVLMVAPPAAMVAMMNEQMGVALRLFVGVAEVLAAVGLILPAATRILPWLTTLAAGGLVPIMAGATVWHLMRGEFSSAVTTTILLALLTALTYLRWKVRPIAARTLRRSGHEQTAAVSGS